MEDGTVPPTAAKIPTPPAEGLLPIRTVAAVTGVNPVTLRAWERRYGLITPQRTPKGHRLYTRQDVERIERIVELLSQGISVGQIKPLLEHTSDTTTLLPAADDIDIWQRYRDRMLAAIEAFDEPLLENIYNDALSLYPVDLVTRNLTMALLNLLGQRWKQRTAGIAEEHFFSAYLRNKLGARIHHLNRRARGPLLLLACLPNELHDFGLLLFALAAVESGYRVLILGADTPLAQIRAVLDRKPCAAVALSSSTRPARAVLATEFPALTRKPGPPVFIGGATAVALKDRLEQCGLLCVGDEIPTALKIIDKMLAGAKRQRQ
jgi:DNA-binding transcriptional MerR regulator